MVVIIPDIEIDGIPVLREHINVNVFGEIRIYPYAIGIAIIGNVEV